MDRLTPQQRHSNMAAIRCKDTKLEIVVRRGLWKRVKEVPVPLSPTENGNKITYETNRSSSSNHPQG